MTKVDEKAFVPEIDDDARRRLSEALDKEGVVAAMLIGSQARGEAGPLSDVDVAVWHEPELDRDQRWDLQVALIGAACEALKTNEVDLAILNEAPPLFQHRAIRDAVRLVERDHDQRVRFETRAILDYLDTKPLRYELKQGVKHRIEEGRFGRSRKGRLSKLLEELAEIKGDGYDSYQASFRNRLAAAHAIQLAVQICLDIGAHLIAEEGLDMPDDYRGIFASLKSAGLEPELADRLSAAAGMRNVLVHGYLKVDDRAVWDAIARLDDLRQFSSFVKSQLT